MIITRESDYAIRIIRELAKGGKKSVKEICEVELIPQQYAYKILKKLERAGIVKSFRGAKGGYVLMKSVSDLTLLDVLIAMEEDMCVNECVLHNFECPKHTEENPCKIRNELCSLQNAILQQLQGKKMAEIL